MKKNKYFFNKFVFLDINVNGTKEHTKLLLKMRHFYAYEH